MMQRTNPSWVPMNGAYEARPVWTPMACCSGVDPMFPMPRQMGQLCRASVCNSQGLVRNEGILRDSMAEETITDLGSGIFRNEWSTDRRHVLDCGRSKDFETYMERKSARRSEGESLLSYGLDLNSGHEQHVKAETKKGRSENCCTSRSYKSCDVNTCMDELILDDDIVVKPQK